MEGIGLIVIAGFAVLVLMMLMGRKTRYVCRNCGESWKGTRHHGKDVPRCPECGSSDVGPGK